MKKNITAKSFPDLRVYDIRKLNIRKSDVQEICEDFRLGPLKDFEKEKNISVSHSNFVIFVTTERGKFVLKFYKGTPAPDIVKEYLQDKCVEHQRVFLARSDPAMNYGLISAVFLNKIALQKEPAAFGLGLAYAFVNAPALFFGMFPLERGVG